MKVAIVGSGSFIGSRIVEAFHLGRGPSVVAVAQDAVHHRLDGRFAIDQRTADPDDSESLTRAFKGCSAVVYVQQATLNKATFSTLCKACSKAELKKVVFILYQYNETSLGEPQSVDADNPGARVQTAAERQLFADCRKSGVSAYTLNPGVVYGPRSPLIAQIATELQDGRAWLLGNGTPTFNGTYVDNLIVALRLCLSTKAAGGQSFTLGDAETVSWRDLYEAMARELDASASQVRYVDSIGDAETEKEAQESLPVDMQGLSREQRASLQHSFLKVPHTTTAKILGYAPTVPFAEAIRRTCAWWRFAQGETNRVA